MKLKNVENYLPLVYSISSKIYKRLPDYSNIEYEDIVGYGLVGLAEALKKYDENKEVKFSTFAYPFIKGRILDFLRKFEREKTIPENEKIRLDEFVRKSIEEDKIALLGTTNFDPEKYVEKEELMDIVADIIENNLEDIEKIILYLWFKEGLSQREISHVLEISESRVSQLKKHSLEKIKNILKKRKIIPEV